MFQWESGRFSDSYLIYFKCQVPSQSTMGINPLYMKKIPENHSFSHSVQFTCSVMCNPLWPHGLQHARLLCPSPRQASLSITNFQNLLKLMSIELVMPSNHLILCRPLLFLPSIFPSIRVFSNESVLCIRWPKHWSFSFSISPFNEYSGLISSRIDWFDLLASQGLLRVFSNTTVQKHQFFGAQLSL